MLLVKTKVMKSPIAGNGLFADQFIPAGTEVWRFIPGFDVKFSPEAVEKLPIQAQEYIMSYGWLSKKSGKICFALDNGKYFNHSENPSCLSAYYDDEDEVVTKALRDLQPGEEITDNYDAFLEGFDKSSL